MNLSIKNVPDDVVHRLRQRAERNHRSLQGELAAIVEEAAREAAAHGNGVLEVWAEVQRLGLRTPADAVEIVRSDRNRDEGR